MSTSMDGMKIQTHRSSFNLVKNAISTIFAWVVGAVLAVSGFAHAANPVYFVGSILQYGLFSPMTAGWIAAGLPWIEIGIASMLILEVRREEALICSTFLSVCFVLVQAWAVWKGLQIDCGCFGSLTARPVGVASISIAAGLGVLSFLSLIVLRNLESQK